MSANNALQAALIAQLRPAFTGLLPDFGGAPAVFFQVPQQFDDSQPYVCIYELPMTQDDTDNTFGYSVTLNVHTWVQERTTQQTGDIMQVIYDTLNRYDQLIVLGYTVSGIDFEFSSLDAYMLEPFSIAFSKCQHATLASSFGDVSINEGDCLQSLFLIGHLS